MRARLSRAASGSSWSASYLRPASLLFWAVHITAVAGVIACGWSWRGAALALGSYFLRMVVVTGGYHRYFAHRAFKTSRAFQFLLALAAESSAQAGVLWWASHHRWHHRTSDTAEDVHSPRQRGFWYAHVGWLLANDWKKTDLTLVSDLAKYPELRFLDRVGVHIAATALLALGFLLVGGVHGLVWGYMVSTVLLWHGSFAINSLAHLVGKRRYDTDDDSRNNWVLALLTSGEGWHNNHHHYQSSANQGFRWWEIDVTYACLRVLEQLGLVWDLRRPPREVVEARADSPRRSTPGGVNVRA
jgi:stearoyl-CoA desaturase (delta-9 desaturase)